MTNIFSSRVQDRKRRNSALLHGSSHCTGSDRKRIGVRNSMAGGHAHMCKTTCRFAENNSEAAMYACLLQQHEKGHLHEKDGRKDMCSPYAWEGGGQEGGRWKRHVHGRHEKEEKEKEESCRNRACPSQCLSQWSPPSISPSLLPDSLLLSQISGQAGMARLSPPLSSSQ